MTAFESYKMYVALKLHFTTDSYDYFKFNGKTRVSETNFEKRKDRYFFKKLTNRKKDDEILPYFVANFVADSSGWIGNMVRSDGDDNYRAWKKHQKWKPIATLSRPYSLHHSVPRTLVGPNGTQALSGDLDGKKTLPLYWVMATSQKVTLSADRHSPLM